MVHGVAGYFVERARFERRVALLTLGVSIGVFSLFGLTVTPPVRRMLQRAVARFGYEGPTQYVRRIMLSQLQGTGEAISELGPLNPVPRRRGGDARKRHTDPLSNNVEIRPRIAAPGTSNDNLIERVTSRAVGVPVVQSEELVIDVLVRPDYPTSLAERNIEGKVMVQALVDTTGKVVDVQVMASTGESQFERAAEKAVWQCRFRPHRLNGITSEVYAVFRFAFRIY